MNASRGALIDRVLIDTNVLVYAADPGEPVKGNAALAILDRVLRAGAGAVTTQVVGEFFVCLTKKAKLGLSVPEARVQVRALTAAVDVLPVTIEIVDLALRGVERYGMPFYDAQLWAAARLAAVPVLLTEDGPSGAEIEGVLFVNPFADGFDLETLLAG